MKKIILSLLIVFIFCSKTYSSNLIAVSSELMLFPLLKNSNVTFLYGVKGFSEINQNIRLDYSFYFNILNDLILSVPITLSYIPDGNYKFNIRPQMFIGINPFFSNIQDFSGIKFYGILGFGIDYIFENKHVINFSTKVYINDSFIKSEVNNYAFNTGVIGLNLSYGMKY
ncbi:MAG: hypothetical protein KatS3mg068_0874 [Candidatus Sericytochromatia bacterium]|nr:MAG: hypothetical protein KatS3mg068_0874 [Candidatus Sericytochromatia bacterium]